MKARDAFEIVKQFDELPRDMIMPPKPSAILLGISERTLRRSAPIPRRKITARKSGFRVGDIRDHIRSTA